MPLIEATKLPPVKLSDLDEFSENSACRAGNPILTFLSIIIGVGLLGLINNPSPNPIKNTINKIAKVLKLNHATVGEHLLKAENKMIHSIAKKL